VWHKESGSPRIMGCVPAFFIKGQKPCGCFGSFGNKEWEDLRVVAYAYAYEYTCVRPGAAC
jgi:hypothetical protein